ncbi:MAG: ADP-ribosylglycohydrolase family protein [Oscillospiraceae bacterium]|nr:ADP-ribosylglycohydrolase family protein [Oscillospiraceae bacterium]
MAKEITVNERFEGAFLGFAIGDSFGYPIRDMDFETMCERFEKHGCLELSVSQKTETALFTDATQMALFTADGIVWADREAKGGEINYTTYVFYAYQYWLYTQTNTIAGKEYAWLFDNQKNHHKCRLLKAKGLYQNRFADRTNIDALLGARDSKYGRLISKINDNSDNGGLKRVLPAGLYFNYDSEIAFRAGADFAAITHTAPTGYLAAGCYCAIIADLLNGEPLDNAIKKTLRILKGYEFHEQCYLAIDAALTLIYDDSTGPREAVERLGNGKSAEEALAIALFCVALHSDDFVNAIRLAANHDGASDVCAALAGGLFGAYRGVQAIPKRWLKKMQYYNMLMDIQEELFGVTVFNEKKADYRNDDEDIKAWGDGGTGAFDDFKFE